MDRAGLLGVIRDLYEASNSNRRFLHARFVPAAATLDEYRTLVEAAVFPDPLSQRPIRLRDAAAAITDYKRSTGDLAGVVDLLLTLVEAGTEQAADLGYGEETYFGTLERKANEAASMLEALPVRARAESVARFIHGHGANGGLPPAAAVLKPASEPPSTRAASQDSAPPARAGGCEARTGRRRRWC